MFDDLNALLTEAIDAQREAKAVADARKRIKSTPKSGGYIDPADRQRIENWESQHVWRAEANVAHFVEQQCSRCGECQYIFSGLLERQSHRHLKTDGSQRWVKVESQTANLPNETMLTERKVPMCMECFGEVGFQLKGAYWDDGVLVEWVEDEAAPVADETPSQPEEVAYVPV